MYLEELVEVGIGLIFVWMVISIATIQIQEWIATNILKWRAKDMESAIRKMLGDPVWAEQLYRNPIIAGLSKKTGVKPSYIAANKFAVALFDVVMTTGTDGSYIQQSLHKIQTELNQAPKALGPLIRYIFKRWRKSIEGLFINILNFLFDAQIVTKQTKYEELLCLAQNATTSETAMRVFLNRLISHEYTKGSVAKTRFTRSQFFDEYPGLKELAISLYKKIIAKNRISDDDNFLKGNIDQVLDALGEALNARNNQGEYILRLIEILKFDDEKHGTLERIGTGIELLREINPTLHRSLNTVTLNLQKVSESTTTMDSVRNLFVKTENTIQQQEGRLAKARTEVELWFNDAMDRLSGAYKRKAQAMAFLIGLVLAIILNIDSIELAKHLWREPAVRQVLAANAEKFVDENPTLPKPGEKNPPDVVRDLQVQFASLNLPVGWNLSAYTGDKTVKLFASPNEVAGVCPAYDTDAATPGIQHIFCYEIKNPPPDQAAVLAKFMGILFTALATMQGAPFWFDMLKKLVNIRGTGTNPAEKPANPSPTEREKV